MPDPTYEDVYEPPVLDSTFSDKMDELKAALSPQASGVHVSTANMHYITEDDAQGALAELDAEAYAINSSLTQLITTEVIEVGTQTIAQNARGVFTANVAKQGYTPIGIVKIALSSNYMVIGGFTVNDAGNLQIVIWNYDTSRSQTVYATVLYRKNLS